MEVIFIVNNIVSPNRSEGNGHLFQIEYFAVETSVNGGNLKCLLMTSCVISRVLVFNSSRMTTSLVKARLTKNCFTYQ